MVVTCCCLIPDDQLVNVTRHNFNSCSFRKNWDRKLIIHTGSYLKIVPVVLKVE